MKICPAIQTSGKQRFPAEKELGPSCGDYQETDSWVISEESPEIARKKGNEGKGPFESAAADNDYDDEDDYDDDDPLPPLPSVLPLLPPFPPSSHAPRSSNKSRTPPRLRLILVLILELLFPLASVPLSLPFSNHHPYYSSASLPLLFSSLRFVAARLLFESNGRNGKRIVPLLQPTRSYNYRHTVRVLRLLTCSVSALGLCPSSSLVIFIFVAAKLYVGKRVRRAGRETEQETNVRSVSGRPYNFFVYLCSLLLLRLSSIPFHFLFNAGILRFIRRVYSE